jgi:hypothetical protein
MGRIRTAFKDTFRVLHTFTLEVIGGFFVALALIGSVDGVREYREYLAGTDGRIWRVVLDAIFTVAMLGFGVHSFWKSRKIQK